MRTIKVKFEICANREEVKEFKVDDGLDGFEVEQLIEDEFNLWVDNVGGQNFEIIE
jgi:hypothetical protein